MSELDLLNILYTLVSLIAPIIITYATVEQDVFKRNRIKKAFLEFLRVNLDSLDSKLKELNPKKKLN